MDTYLNGALKNGKPAVSFLEKILFLLESGATYRNWTKEEAFKEGEVRLSDYHPEVLVMLVNSGPFGAAAVLLTKPDLEHFVKEENSRPFAFFTLPFTSLLADLRQLWSPTLMAHGVVVQEEAPNPCLLDVDRKQMEQLFLNLMNNAMDAMPGGGTVKIAIRLAEESTPGGLWWEVRFQDSGQGIPAALLGQVFRPMFTTKAEGKGTGLGLSICREIVRSHGGDIRIESQPGQGTCVVFSLPGATQA